MEAIAKGCDGGGTRACTVVSVESPDEVEGPDGVKDAVCCSEGVSHKARQKITDIIDMAMSSPDSHYCTGADKKGTDAQENIHDDAIDKFGAQFAKTDAKAAVNEPDRGLIDGDGRGQVEVLQSQSMEVLSFLLQNADISPTEDAIPKGSDTDEQG